MEHLDNVRIMNCPYTSKDMKVALEINNHEVGVVRGLSLKEKVN